MITFAQDQLDKYQPRNDYRELLELTIIFLGGTPTKVISFESPAGLHHARWMAKIIYSLKIWIFCAQFKLTTRETNGVQEICLFATRLYLEAWFTAPCSCSAPFQDLRFLKAIHQYPNQNISKIAMKKFIWAPLVPTEELAALAFFDDSIPAAEKHKKVKALDKGHFIIIHQIPYTTKLKKLFIFA